MTPGQPSLQPSMLEEISSNENDERSSIVTLCHIYLHFYNILIEFESRALVSLSPSLSLSLSLVLFELNTIIIDSNYRIRINSKKIIIDIYPFVFRYLFTRSNISNNISNDIKKITYYFIFNSYLIVHNINLSLKLVTI